MARNLIAFAAALALAPFAARAQTNQVDQTQEQIDQSTQTDVTNPQTGVTTQTTTTFETTNQFNQPMRPSLGLIAEVGVNRYTGRLAAPTEPGVSFGARVDISPTRNIGMELTYAGANNSYNDRFSADGSLWTHQAGADIRVNLVPPGFDLPGRLRPFIFGGVAYQRVATHNFTPGAVPANLLSVPAGAGIEADLGGRFLVGARGTYNFLFFEQGSFGGNVANWYATVDLGARL